MKFSIIYLVLLITFQCSSFKEDELSKKKITHNKNNIKASDSLRIKGSFDFIDSVIYTNRTEIPMYPYSEKYDSLESKARKNLKDTLDKAPETIVDVFPPTPELYAVDSLNNKISIQNYLDSIRKKYKGNYHCLFAIKVEWNGKISEVRLKAKKGQLPKNLNLYDVLKNIRAKPAITKYGIPFPKPLIVSLSVQNTLEN
jgi:hypothetical protein